MSRATELAERLSQLANLEANELADAMNEAAYELDRLDRVNAELVEALQKIVAIENQYTGSDWEEIEHARTIARAALTPSGDQNGRQ